MAVDWLAFYQTAKFGDDKWAINFVAPVRGHELTTRAQLLRTQPDHPRAEEPYFKVQIGPLERLPRSIPSRAWRRITFLYTTGEHILHAEELNDLIVQSAEREQLWKALRERGLIAERQYEAGKGAEIDLALLCALGKLGITLGDTGAERPTLKERRGWRYLAFPGNAVRAEVSNVVRRLSRR